MAGLELEAEYDVACDSASFASAPTSDIEAKLDSFWWRSYYGPDD